MGIDGLAELVDKTDALSLHELMDAEVVTVAGPVEGVEAAAEH